MSEDNKKANDDLVKLLSSPVPNVAQAMSMVGNALKPSKKTNGMVPNSNATPESVVKHAESRALASMQAKALKKERREKRRAELRAYTSQVDPNITNDINTLNTQLAMNNINLWKDSGLMSYLLMTHCNSNKFMEYTSSKIMNKSYNDDVINYNTSRFGLTNDKGFIGFISLKELPYVSVKPLLEYLGVSYKQLLDILKYSDKDKEDNNNIFYYRNMYLSDQYVGSIEMSSRYRTNLNSYASGNLYNQLYSESFIDMYKQSNLSSTLINIFLLEDILFTTTNRVNLSSIDALQEDTSLSIPCSGIIQDVLTEYILSTECTGEYFCNGSKNLHSSLLKNPFYEESAIGGSLAPTTFDSNGYIHSEFYPITNFQRGGNDKALFTIKFQKVGKEYQLPIGDILPIAKLACTNDVGGKKVVIIPLSLTENGIYDMDTLKLAYKLDIDKSSLNLYEKEELNNLDKQTMYSQAVIEVQNKIKGVVNEIATALSIKLEEANNISLTDNTSYKVGTALASTVYNCPIRINTNKEFNI